MKVFDVLGWCGVLLIIGAYVLITLGVVRSDDVVYSILNLFGAFGVIFSSLTKKDTQPIVLNSFWALIAIVGIIRSLVG